MQILRAQVSEVVRTVGIVAFLGHPKLWSPKSRILRMTRRAMSVLSRRRPLAQAAASAVIAVALPFGPSAKPRVMARTARSERLAIIAHLDYLDARGSYLIEDGSASGPLAGPVKARIRVAADISGSFTFEPHGGTISGTGVGTLHESGRYASFGGSVTVLGGTGRYAHARGGGRLYGVYDRDTLDVTIQTTGSLSY